MKRVRAQALALVNWRGVFYERYLLDRHVTALEGANGAGKTTVMIATYVVLLPDVTRLRFTNLGESGAIGGDRGLYGRLGEPGRPSYAVLDLVQADGTRVLAGVQLERRSEPTVELTPFILTGLAPDVALQEVLLSRTAADPSGPVLRDEIPELQALREMATMAGGKLTTFSTAKEYFGALFERGITPLRLAVDEERKKYNDMLRTSMVGGISRALTGELRDFLLKEETGLADTLRRMRENLEACRRTRREVEESRRLEAEIHGVYQAGQEMFAAALFATRARLRESEQRLEEARRLQVGRQERLDLVFGELARAEETHRQARQALEEARHRESELREQRDRVKTAHDIHARLRGLQAEVAEIEPREAEARLALEAAEQDFQEARRQTAKAEADRDAAARGLADFQAGFAELQRRAAAHRLAVEARERVHHALDTRTADFAGLQVETLRRMQEHLNASIRLERAEATAAEKRREFRRVLEALQRLAEAAVDPVQARPRALEVLAALRNLKALIVELPLLPDRLSEARRLARAQAEARSEAEALGVGTADEVGEVLETIRRRAADLEEELRQQQTRATEASRQEQAAEGRLAELREVHLHWKALQEEAATLSTSWEHPLTDRQDLQALLDALGVRRDGARQQAVEQTAEVQALHDEIRQLEGVGGHFPPELLRARDLAEGELLAGRFEEVEVGQAARQQALLGPLAEALLVEDAPQAARLLAQDPGVPDTVWLVDGTAVLPLLDEEEPTGEALPGSVLVPDQGAWRLTREPRHPVLGRRARERRIGALKRQHAEAEQVLERTHAALRRLDAGARAAGALWPRVDLLEREDPARDILQTLDLRQRAADEREGAQARLDSLHPALESAHARRQALETLLPRADLLDRPDLAVEVRALEERLEQARQAERRLEVTAVDRQEVELGLEILQTLPPSDHDLERFRAERLRAEAERDRLAPVARDLEYLLENLPALAWSDAQETLRRQGALKPGLEEQMRRAEGVLEACRGRQSDSEKSTRDARDRWDARRHALEVKQELLLHEEMRLEETGVEDPSPEALAAAIEAHRSAEVSSRDWEARERESGGAEARLQERLEVVQVELEVARKTVADEENVWRPAQDRWTQLQQLAAEHQVLAAATTPTFDLAMGSRPAVNLWTLAQRHRTELVERLGASRDGAQTLARVHDQAGEDPDLQQGERYLNAWLAVRDWLRRRIPAQIAEVDEPLEALEHLRSHLARLQDRLGQQEGDLRGQSSDVARNIETHVRRARRQVLHLNSDLARVRFGSIRSVRLRLGQIQKMWDLLEGLKEDQAQHLLFEATMPIEEALDELFRRQGGGSTSGRRLLDYREYVDLRVEVQREGSAAWEQANPTRMSTGEAIGVGAAVMMVVLTAWEQDANLLRKTRTSGTLRLLFLDEANRLSRDNLAILFDLCRNLQLQLLIAAPEVAQAEGNTTYHLVRRVDAHGREEVLVSGRRTVGEGLVSEPVA